MRYISLLTVGQDVGVVKIAGDVSGFFVGTRCGDDIMIGREVVNESLVRLSKLLGTRVSFTTVENLEVHILLITVRALVNVKDFGVVDLTSTVLDFMFLSFLDTVPDCTDSMNPSQQRISRVYLLRSKEDHGIPYPLVTDLTVITICVHLVQERLYYRKERTITLFGFYILLGIQEDLVVPV